MFKDLQAEKLGSDISQLTCSDFIYRERTSPRNQINDRLALSNFFSWAVKREYAAANPVQKVDRPEVDDNAPKILALEDCGKLFAAARDHKDGLLLPYVTLGSCAGLRPAELSRPTWSKIDLEEGAVTIDGSMAITRQRRFVKLSDNAIAWLKDYAVEKPPLAFSNFQRDFAKVKNAAGFDGKEDEKGLRPWVADCMRHTAIRNHFAHHKHEDETASWAGNSPNVIHRHYKALLKAVDAKEFWTITPATVKRKIAKFPGQAAAA